MNLKHLPVNNKLSTSIWGVCGNSLRFYMGEAVSAKVHWKVKRIVFDEIRTPLFKFDRYALSLITSIRDGIRQ